MENVNKPEQVVFLGVVFVVFCVLAWWWLNSGKKEDRTPVDFDPVEIVAGVWSALLNWRPIPVKRLPDSAPVVMSRSVESAPPSMPSSVQTDGVQTPDQTDDPAARRKKLFDTYKPLRKLGMKRDEASVFLHGLGLPLDNNVWAEVGSALEAEANMHVTPIVGRPTNAKFEVTDPDYPFEPCHS